METKSVGIRKFRPTQSDLQALRDATDKLEAVMSLTDDEIELAVRDFDALRKGAALRAALKETHPPAPETAAPAASPPPC